MTDEQRARCSAVHMGQAAWNKCVPMTEEERKKHLKASSRAYYARNVAKEALREKVYKSTLSEEVKEENKERAKEYNVAYYAVHHEEDNARSRAYHSRHRSEEATRHAIRYAAHREESLSYAKLYSQTPKGKEVGQRARRNTKARRRIYGFNALNSPFPNCDAHHINPQDIIYMPRALHRSIYHNQRTGKGMVTMNALAGAFLTEDWT